LLSEQQVQKLKEAFEKVDTNNDGFVTHEELKSLIESLGEEIDDQTV